MYERTYGPVYLWAHSQRAVRQRRAPYLSRLRRPVMWTPTGTGLDQRSELRRLGRRGYLEGKSVLVVGVGDGDEVLEYWISSKVARLAAIDVNPEVDWKPSLAWQEVARRAASEGIATSFAVADGTRLPFASDSFDLVYSKSVLEHVGDPDALIAESARVLRSGGAVYALFGPLWFTYNGPHVDTQYDHLLLSPEEYADRVREVGLPWQVRFVERDLFSHMKAEEYLNLFARHFALRRVVFAGSPDAERYRAANPRQWEELMSRYDELDLRTRLVCVLADSKK